MLIVRRILWTASRHRKDLVETAEVGPQVPRSRTKVSRIRFPPRTVLRHKREAFVKNLQYTLVKEVEILQRVREYFVVELKKP